MQISLVSTSSEYFMSIDIPVWVVRKHWLRIQKPLMAVTQGDEYLSEIRDIYTRRRLSSTRSSAIFQRLENDGRHEDVSECTMRWTKGLSEGLIGQIRFNPEGVLSHMASEETRFRRSTRRIQRFVGVLWQWGVLVSTQARKGKEGPGDNTGWNDPFTCS